MPRERWPSSNRIAASTEPPSCTRAARRVGCGWGKWVIAGIDYATRFRVTGDNGSTSPNSHRHNHPNPGQLIDLMAYPPINQEDNGRKDGAGFGVLTSVPTTTAQSVVWALDFKSCTRVAGCPCHGDKFPPARDGAPRECTSPAGPPFREVCRPASCEVSSVGPP